jgi:hypothetical protein
MYTNIPQQQRCLRPSRTYEFGWVKPMNFHSFSTAAVTLSQSIHEISKINSQSAEKIQQQGKRRKFKRSKSNQGKHHIYSYIAQNTQNGKTSLLSNIPHIQSLSSIPHPHFVSVDPASHLVPSGDKLGAFGSLSYST